MGLPAPVVKIDSAAVARFMQDPNGPVLRKMLIVGEALKVRTAVSLKDGFPRDFLAPGIVKRVETTSEGPRVLVGSSHLRTRPHSMTGNPLLVFFWPKAGKVVFFRHVNHLGSNFAAYLGDRLLAALLSLRGAI